MTAQVLLQDRKKQLADVIRKSFGNNLHSDAFAMRILGAASLGQIHPHAQLNFFPATPDRINYEGVPRIASVGFGIGTDRSVPDGMVGGFISALERLQHRSANNLQTLADDVALLGIADGIAHLKDADRSRVGETKDWLIQIIERTAFPKQWSYRMRSLAGDLLENRGRLRVLPDSTDIDALALELALRESWPLAFLETPGFSQDTYDSLLHALLAQPAPKSGDLEKAVVWLKALDVIVDIACKSLLPTISDTVHILKNVQHSLKRWRFEERPRRAGVKPSQWLIDNEYDVQALLWAILYPIYEAELVDEVYLQNWGNVQPRADLGILKLKLIIEIKIAREPSDFRELEEQIAGDTGLYFKDPTQFDRMIAFIYDDCDKHEPERYDSLKNALKKREQIEDVIIIRRPSMIPDRKERGPV